MDETQLMTQRMEFSDDDLNTSKIEEKPLAFLNVVDGECLPIYFGENTIGRDVNRASVVIKHETVSKLHAIIDGLASACVIHDCSSMNRTKIGKVVCIPEIRYSLRDGDTIQFGDIVVDFKEAIDSTKLDNFVPETPFHEKATKEAMKNFSPTAVSSPNSHVRLNITAEKDDKSSTVSADTNEKDETFDDSSFIACTQDNNYKSGMKICLKENQKKFASASRSNTSVRSQTIEAGKQVVDETGQASNGSENSVLQCTNVSESLNLTWDSDSSLLKTPMEQKRPKQDALTPNRMQGSCSPCIGSVNKNKINKESIYNLETQICDESLKNKNQDLFDEDLAANKRDSIYNAETQVFCDDMQDKSDEERRNSIFLKPTQLLQNVTKNDNEADSDDIFNTSTELISQEKTDEEPESRVDNLAPNFSATDKNLLNKSSLVLDSDDLEETQILDEDLFFQPTKCNNLKTNDDDTKEPKPVSGGNSEMLVIDQSDDESTTSETLLKDDSDVVSGAESSTSNTPVKNAKHISSDDFASSEALYSNAKKKILLDDDADELMLQPTQILNEIPTKVVKLSRSGKNILDNHTKPQMVNKIGISEQETQIIDNNDISLQETQIVNTINVNEANKGLTEIKLKQDMNVSNDDISFQETQIVNPPNLFEIQTDSNNRKSITKEDISLQETQLLNSNICAESDAAAKYRKFPIEKEETHDDISLQQTQILDEKTHTGGKTASDRHAETISLQETQLVNIDELKLSENVGKNDISLNNSSEEDISLLQTQILDNSKTESGVESRNKTTGNEVLIESTKVPDPTVSNSKSEKNYFTGPVLNLGAYLDGDDSSERTIMASSDTFSNSTQCLAEYPSTQSFLEMVEEEEYNRIHGPLESESFSDSDTERVVCDVDLTISPIISRGQAHSKGCVKNKPMKKVMKIKKSAKNLNISKETTYSEKETKISEVSHTENKNDETKISRKKLLDVSVDKAQVQVGMSTRRSTRLSQLKCKTSAAEKLPKYKSVAEIKTVINFGEKRGSATKSKTKVASTVVGAKKNNKKKLSSACKERDTVDESKYLKYGEQSEDEKNTSSKLSKETKDNKNREVSNSDKRFTLSFMNSYENDSDDEVAISRLKKDSKNKAYTTINKKSQIISSPTKMKNEDEIKDSKQVVRNKRSSVATVSEPKKFSSNKMEARPKKASKDEVVEMVPSRKRSAKNILTLPMADDSSFVGQSDEVPTKRPKRNIIPNRRYSGENIVGTSSREVSKRGKNKRSLSPGIREPVSETRNKSKNVKTVKAHNMSNPSLTESVGSSISSRGRKSTAKSNVDVPVSTKLKRDSRTSVFENSTIDASTKRRSSRRQKNLASDVEVEIVKNEGLSSAHKQKCGKGRSFLMEKESVFNKDSPISSRKSTLIARQNYKVMFTGYENKQDEKIVASLGGIMDDSFSTCTVLITDKVRRTTKFLCAVARGIPIVSPAWVLKSKDAKYLLDPWHYLIEDKNSEERYGFKLEASLQQKHKLLTGYKVYTFTSVSPSPEQMKEIVESAGGKAVDTLPKRPAKNFIVIYSENDTKELQAAKKAKLDLFHKELILTGILQQKLDMEKYKIIV